MRRAARVMVLGGGMLLLSSCGAGGSSEVTPSPQQSETGAVQTLSDSALEGQHAASIAELLQGRVPGLEVIYQPNGEISLRIRGGDVSPMGGGAGTREPLLVIDGMAVSTGNVTRALNSLRPHEIDNIQVLKDVASTSVYGMRGAHGVIVITTKR